MTTLTQDITSRRRVNSSAPEPLKSSHYRTLSNTSNGSVNSRKFWGAGVASSVPQGNGFVAPNSAPTPKSSFASPNAMWGQYARKHVVRTADAKTTRKSESPQELYYPLDAISHPIELKIALDFENGCVDVFEGGEICGTCRQESEVRERNLKWEEYAKVKERVLGEEEDTEESNVLNETKESDAVHQRPQISPPQYCPHIDVNQLLNDTKDPSSHLPSVKHITAELFAIKVNATLLPPSHLTHHVQSPVASPNGQGNHFGGDDAPTTPQHTSMPLRSRVTQPIKFPIRFRDLIGFPHLVWNETFDDCVTQTTESNSPMQFGVDVDDPAIEQMTGSPIDSDKHSTDSMYRAGDNFEALLEENYRDCRWRPRENGLLHLTIRTFAKEDRHFSVSLFEGNQLRQGVYLLDLDTGFIEKEEYSRIEAGIRARPLDWLDRNTLSAVRSSESKRHESQNNSVLRIEFPQWKYQVLAVPPPQPVETPSPESTQSKKFSTSSASKSFTGPPPLYINTAQVNATTSRTRVQSVISPLQNERFRSQLAMRRPSTAFGGSIATTPLGSPQTPSGKPPSFRFAPQTQRFSRAMSEARPLTNSNVITIEEFVQDDFIFIDDPEDNSNPCEEKHMQMSLNLTGDHTNLKPNTEESKRLREIIEMSPLQEMKMDQKELLWKYRYYLLPNKQALIKFLRSVDWSNHKQAQEARSLLAEWSEMLPLDAIELLSSHFKDIDILRVYAIHILKKTDNETLSDILLELVQSLRYEADMINSDLGTFLLERAKSNFDICNKLNWYLQVEVKADKNPNSRKQYEKIARFLWIYLRKTKNERCEKYVEKLARQRKFLEELNELGQAIKRSKGDRPKKIQKLKKILLDEKQWGKEKFFSNISSKLPPSYLTLPVNPSISVSGISAEKSTIFKSAMNPILLPFITADDEDDDDEDETREEGAEVQTDNTADDESTIASQSTTTTSTHTTATLDTSTTQQPDSASTSSEISTSTTKTNSSTKQESIYRVIYKSGDDLRQDQLAIQMITLMDKLLKRNGLDLKLIPYKVLATSAETGFVECVTPNKALSAVISTSKGDIAKWLKAQNRPEDIDECFNNFIRSCAGYSVITYILGVGDRHLDNILLKPNGQLFHIDFGFILGRDPKPFPPPMRLCKEMVVAMKNMPGDKDNENGYQKFIQLCCTSFNIIRRYTKLILNMLILMADANIPDLMHGNDPIRNIMKVEEKLNPLLSDNEASHFMKSVIHESERAIVAVLTEKIHSIAQYVRS